MEVEAAMKGNGGVANTERSRNADYNARRAAYVEEQRRLIAHGQKILAREAHGLPITETVGSEDGGYSADMGFVLPLTGDSLHADEYATLQAFDICERLVPEWRELFLQKNFKYRLVTNDLGARGVFPDINRKIGILKDRVWDGHASAGADEDADTRRVVLDLIGHLFLMLHMMDEAERDA